MFRATIRSLLSTRQIVRALPATRGVCSQLAWGLKSRNIAVITQHRPVVRMAPVPVRQLATAPSGGVIEVENENDFKTRTAVRDRLVVIDFHALWYGLCNCVE